MLRKPLHQLKGSERDAWGAMAHHQMVVDEQGSLVAVGRSYINADNEASIRFMAVHPDVQDKGLGTLMATTLESVACQEGIKRTTCSACEDTVESFTKLRFINQRETTTPTTMPIRHFLMIKPVATLDDILHRGDRCAQLQQARYEHIPLSEKMGACIQQYAGQKSIITMLEIGNQNLHCTLSVGSLFPLATFTGWGLIWLMLRECHLDGTIILADTHIRYSKPISDKPHAVAGPGALSGDLDRLACGRKAWMQMQVETFGDGTSGTVLEGTYIVPPAKPSGPYEEGGNEREQLMERGSVASLTHSGYLHQPPTIPVILNKNSISFYSSLAPYVSCYIIVQEYLNIIHRVEWQLSQIMLNLSSQFRFERFLIVKTPSGAILFS